MHTVALRAVVGSSHSPDCGLPPRRGSLGLALAQALALTASDGGERGWAGPWVACEEYCEGTGVAGDV